MSVQPNSERTAHRSDAPFVSYLVAAFNAECTLSRAIESLLAQDSPDWEAVIVDDGSTDGTLAVARSYAQADHRISVVAQSNAGTARARNAAAAVARGRFLAVLDSDDELDRGHLSRMIRLVEEHPDCRVFSSDGVFLRDGREPELVFGYARELSVGLKEELGRSMILGGGTLIDAAAFRSLGGFDPGIYCEDYDLWLRALAHGFEHIAAPEPLYMYHLGVAGQKSEDKQASMLGAARAISGLLATDTLDGEQRLAAEAALASYRRDAVMEAQAVRLEQSVTRVFGPRRAPRVLALIRRATGITRPLRRWAAGR